MNYIAENFTNPHDFFVPISAKDKAKIDEWCYFCAMELDSLSIYILRRHEKIENFGLANLYGEAPNAIKTAREHFLRMINACERDVPNENWLMGNSPSCADIMFMSCLQSAKLFNLEIKSEKIMSYFKKRLTQAPDDAQYVLDYALENAKTRQEQEDVCNALTFKTQVLWSMLDALHFSYYDPGIIPPGAFIPKK